MVGGVCKMSGLIQVSANVPEEFQKKKNAWGVSWAYIIREGIKNIEIQEKLMNEKLQPNKIDWRIEAREKIQRVLRDFDEKEARE